MNALFRFGGSRCAPGSTTIAEENSISGDVVYVLNGELFPDYAPVYIVDEVAGEVVFLFLRENRRA